MRELEIGGRCLRIEEEWAWDNEAGAVVWDAALVLSHYLSGEAIGIASRVGAWQLCRCRRINPTSSSPSLVDTSPCAIPRNFGMQHIQSWCAAGAS